MPQIDAKHKILSLYIALSFIALSIIIPNTICQNIGFFGSIILLIATYVFRKNQTENSLEEHHATFIIRTIWIWSLFLSIAMIAMMTSILLQGDNSAFTNLINRASNGEILTEADTQNMMDEYIKTNYNLIITTAIICMAPPQIYVAYRIIKGTSKAIMGYRINNFRNWF